MQSPTQTSERYVGMDIHKHLVVVCIIDDTGQVLLRHRCGCSRLDLEQFGRRYLQATDKIYCARLKMTLSPASNALKNNVFRAL